MPIGGEIHAERQAFLLMTEHSDFLALCSGPRKNNPETLRIIDISLCFTNSVTQQKVYFTGGNSLRSSSVCIFVSNQNHKRHGELYSCDICSNPDDQSTVCIDFTQTFLRMRPDQTVSKLIGLNDDLTLVHSVFLDLPSALCKNQRVDVLFQQ